MNEIEKSFRHMHQIGYASGLDIALEILNNFPAEKAVKMIKDRIAMAKTELEEAK